MQARLEQAVTTATEWARIAFDYLSQPATLIQVGLIVVLYVPALLLSRKVEPLLEERARQIKRMPGLLRLIVALLRRMEWVFFSLLLGISFVVIRIVGMPASAYLVYSAMLLAIAWLVISVVSHVIRSRTLGKMFSLVAWIYVAALVLGVSDDIATLMASARIFGIGDANLTLLKLLQGLVFFGVTLWAALSVGNFLDRRVQEVDELTPSLRVLIGKIVRITLLVLAVTVAMSSLGINLTALTVLSGAVGVGIGFGLQKVVSNFISGIIILLDQSIKPGDTISLGQTFGWVRELRARFVSVVTRDGREYLIPNEDFITQEVINWSFSDEYVRLDVPFGVSYSSDPHEVTLLAIEAAADIPRVDSTRNKPVCWMTEFGDSSLNFLLRFWIRDPQQGLTNIRGKVLLALWDKFKEHGVNIPFPHREIVMKTPVTVNPAQKPAD